MAITLLASEISGLSLPTYNSGAANKLYVDGNFHPSAMGVFPYISTQTLNATQLGGDLDLNSFGVSGLGYGLELSPSGLILPVYSNSGGSWKASSNPPIGLMYISGTR